MENSGAILDYPISFNGGDGATYGITLNNQRDTAGEWVEASKKDCYLVERFDFSPLDFRDQRDGLHLAEGGDLGMVSGQFRFLSLSGVVMGSTQAKLEDRVAKLLAAFHPSTRAITSLATRGIGVLDFYCPTDEAPSGHASPVREKFLARPTGLPAVFERRSAGKAYPFALQMICADVRRYLYTAESKVANSGNGFSVALPNWTAKQGADTAPVTTLVLTGAGHASCTLRYADPMLGTNVDLVLDLSGIGGGAHTIVIDHGAMTIKEGSTHKASLRTSAVDTFWRIRPGSGTLTVTGTTNLTSVTVAYNQARA